jgi:TolA-binding protein
MGFFTTLFKKSTTEADLEGAKKERDAFLGQPNLTTDDASKAINAAADLMLHKKFAEAIAAYTGVMDRYPDHRGTAESQIGAAHYFLGDFHQAMAFYAAAREHGESASMMDDNIWEAAEALVKNGEKAAAQKYLDLCPTGSYVKKAKKALS